MCACGKPSEINARIEPIRRAEQMYCKIALLLLFEANFKPLLQLTERNSNLFVKVYLFFTSRLTTLINTNANINKVK